MKTIRVSEGPWLLTMTLAEILSLSASETIEMLAKEYISRMDKGPLRQVVRESRRIAKNGTVRGRRKGSSLTEGS